MSECPPPAAAAALARAFEPIRARVRGAVPESTWELWLEAVHLHAIDDRGVLHLAVHEPAVAWVEASFMRLLAAAAGPRRRVVLEACAGPPEPSSHGSSATAADERRGP